MSMKSLENLLYKPEPNLWKLLPSKTVSPDFDEICTTCDSIKDREIDGLKTENRKLKKLIAFLQGEVRALELKSALTAKAVPLEDMVKEVTATPGGKRAWEAAWKEQTEEWRTQMEKGTISKVKFYRLLSGIDQKTLAKKLGMAQPNISRIERPGYNVPAATLRKLAKIFKVKMEDLVAD